MKQLRQSLDLSQEAFAEKAGLKYKHYQAIEAGRKSDIRFSTLEKLAKACGLEAWELLNFESDLPALAEDPVDAVHPKTPQKPARRLRKGRD